jgi:hypothetical protein
MNIDHLRQLLQQHGATFADCVQAFGTAGPEIDAARAKYHRDGEIELDPVSVVSPGGEGVYVMAWVWVSEEEVDLASGK